MIFDSNEIELETLKFLNKLFIKPMQLDIILHSDINCNLISSHSNAINYLKYSGLNYSASAFATHVGFDYLSSKSKNKALVINNLCPNSLGFILLENNE